MHDRFRVGVHCSRGVGPARGGRARNEDNFLVAWQGRARFLEGGIEREVRASHGAGLMVVVADGMGGHDNGAIASAAAVQAMLRLYNRGRPRDPATVLPRFVREAHHRLRDRAARATQGGTRMGTTLTVLWILDNTAWYVHVGDSRLYLLRSGGLSCVTRDHVRAEFARRDGRPTPPQPAALSQSFIFGSRGLGCDSAVRIDEGIDSGGIELRPHDRFLLCSDGLYGRLTHNHLADGLAPRSDRPPRAVADLLAHSAMTEGTDDNVTAIVVQVDQTLLLDDSAAWRLFDEPPTEPRLHPSRSED